MIFAASNVKLVCPGRTFALGAALLIFALLGGAGDAVAAPKPRITSPTTASGTIGVPFSYQITADQVITTWGASPLPAGLSVNTANGLISGTPTVTGTFSVTLSATNGNGTGTGPLTLTINPPPNGLFVGFRLPDFLLGSGAPNNPRLMLQMGATQGTTANPFNVTLEVLVPGTTTWVPYNRFVGIGDSASWITDAPLPVRDSAGSSGTPQAFSVGQLTLSPPAVYMKADPRATRFGIFQMDAVLTTTKSRIVLPLWPSGNATVANGFGGTVGTTFPGPVEHAPNRFSGAAYYPATFAINGPVDARDNAITTYADNDGVTRPADAKYTGGTSGTSTGASTPYYFDPLNPTTSIVYHPVMLNRPFRNVAELGYAFRDLPWKTLDFFTDKSADAGLLDIFTINDGPPGVGIGGLGVTSMAQPTITAGSLNLNSLYLDPNNSTLAPVGPPIVAGAIWDEISNSTGSGTGAQSAQTITRNVANTTSATPMQNKSELITRVDPNTNAKLVETILPPAANDNQAVKARREVVARAMSSTSQTRVWNLLIDVVAQSGHYKPNANNLQNDFIVEGEQHYWVHVSIDRFTGQVIDKQIEVVNE